MPKKLKTYSQVTTRRKSITERLGDLKCFPEQLQKGSFDWRKFLSQPYPQDIEWREARVLSSEWVTCACGNQCAVIPRTKAGEPKNKKLRQLGMLFAFEVGARDATEALQVLDEIEKQSDKILRALEKKQQRDHAKTKNIR